MIEAQTFIEAARQRGFVRYTGVPCSFLTPFINYVINDRTLSYISSANEGDAVATAAGAAIGGQRAVTLFQNSGLGNAVSPLTSLSYVFRIPTLLICTHRGEPDAQDEPQHELMGRITGQLFDTMQVVWEPFPAQAQAVEPALDRALAHLQGERRPYAFLMRKGSVAPSQLLAQPAFRPCLPAHEPRRYTRGVARPSRSEALRTLADRTAPDKTVLVATTGYTGRELYALADRPNHLYMVGSMGCASSLGLGLSLACPDRQVVIIDGDGAALMRMGNLATIGAYAGPNLVHLVLDNEAHDSTGAQATVSSAVSFARIAQGCGYGLTMEGDDPALIPALLQAEPDGRPRLGHLKIRTGTLDPLPRPAITPRAVVERLMAHIGTRF